MPRPDIRIDRGPEGESAAGEGVEDPKDNCVVVKGGMAEYAVLAVRILLLGCPLGMAGWLFSDIVS